MGPIVDFGMAIGLVSGVLLNVLRLKGRGGVACGDHGSYC